MLGIFVNRVFVKKAVGRKGFPESTFALGLPEFFEVTSATFQDSDYQIYLYGLSISIVI